MSSGASDATGIRAVVEVMARALADRPDDVRVTESLHKQITLIEVSCAGDIAKVLGRQGRTVAAFEPRVDGRRARRKSVTGNTGGR